mgnify:CR=1 FL=1
MKYEVIHLKDRFPFLGEDGKDPNVTVYLPDPMWEMGWDDKKRPCMVVVPGGGYGMCSDREASVKQEYSLLGPSGKISTCGDRSTCLGLYFLKDIP